MARKPSSKMNMSAGKAKAILSDGETRGTPLTKPQKGLFGAIAGGAGSKPTGGGTMPRAAGGGPRPGIGGSSSKARTSPRSPQMAIGQRATLGARTKSAMMPRVRSRS
jgi:hypothetical protein